MAICGRGRALCAFDCNGECSTGVLVFFFLFVSFLYELAIEIGWRVSVCVGCTRRVFGVELRFGMLAVLAFMHFAAYFRAFIGLAQMLCTNRRITNWK